MADVDVDAVQDGSRPDRVIIEMPPGRGVTFAYWFHRVFTETPEQREQRRQADRIAELTA